MLSDVPVVGGLKPAVVTAVEKKSAQAFVKNLGPVTIPVGARPALTPPL